ACNHTDIITVPEGKRLVIEHLSSESILPAPNRVRAVRLDDETSLSLKTIVHAAPMFTVPVAGFNEDIVSQSMNIYSDTSLAACVTVTNQSSASVSVIVSGYLVNRP